MPRAGIPRGRLGRKAPLPPSPKSYTPRLWNAHRRVDTGAHQQALNIPLAEAVEKKLVSPDVAEFLKTKEALRREKEEAKVARLRQELSKKHSDGKEALVEELALKLEKNEESAESRKDRQLLLSDPSHYFSNPNKVPGALRKQVYFPMWTVTLMRTPHLPPKYASFDVPLWFNKLDMKSYLRSVYKTEVLHVRSVVLQSKVERSRDSGRGMKNEGQGRMRRPASKKKMTVELVKPFVWPEPVQDLSPWDNEQYWAIAKQQSEAQKEISPDAILLPNEKQRKSIAVQAKELLEGKATWKPTWQSIPADVKVMQGSRRPPSLSP